MNCNRCGKVSDDVALRDDCEICSPVYLCNDCHNDHANERNQI